MVPETNLPYNSPTPSPRGGGPRRAKPGLSPGLIGGLGAAAVLIVVGAAPRFEQHRKLAADAHAAVAAAPIVSVVKTKTAGGGGTDGAGTLLPGNIQALDETTISARATGYVKAYYADIGSRVKAGQVLAEIESPDMDQQVLAAQADAQKAQAGVGQSRAEAARMTANVSQAAAGAAQAQAGLQTARADVNRYEAKALQAQAAVSSAKAALARAQEGLSGRRADLKRAEVARNIADVTLERWKQLGVVNAVSGEEVDQKQADFDTADANVTASQAAVQGATADVDAARSSIAAAQQDAAAAQSDVTAARQRVSAAQASLQSARAGIVAAKESANAGQENVAAAQAATLSSVANVRRYAAMQGFQKVVAPFDGVITARNIDVGSLVGAGSGSGGGGGEADPMRTVTHSGLFGIARTDALRIQVNVPEEMVTSLRVGQPAKVTLSDFPGRAFVGKVLNKSGALDEASRTMLVEILVPNPSGQLVPGMGADVEIVGMQGAKGVIVPADTLLVDANGTRVAEVTPQGKVHFQTVQIGHDLGSTVEVSSGLTGRETLIEDPSDDLTEGERVSLATPVAPASGVKDSKPQAAVRAGNGAGARS